MVMEFKDQVVIITGSGRGIGAAAAKQFAKKGAKLVINDLNEEPAEQVAAEINDGGGEAIAFAGDVTEIDFPEKIVAATIKKYGKLNILVNNAGYTWDAFIQKMTEDQWQAIIDVHITAPFRMIKAATAYMRGAALQEIEAGKISENRCVINVSSVSGLHGNIGQANYATAKAGIIGLTKTIAKEWGPIGIRANTVAYGYIDTRLSRAKEKGEAINVKGKEVALGIPEKILQQLDARVIPLGRAGNVDEAAAGIIMLASPQASYITGHTLEVTGGFGI